MTKELLLRTVQELIKEGRGVLESEFDAGSRIRNVVYVSGRPKAVDLQQFARWQAGCLNLLRLLGELGTPWMNVFENKKNTPGTSMRMLGTLEAIEHAIRNGLLIQIEEIIRAETFTHLLDQADYLLSEGYFVASGVLGRAVLEEHLQNWCIHSHCQPSKKKPTVNDYKDALYKGKHITLPVMKHVDSMAAVGNEAAHNKEGLARDAVERLLRDIRDFLAKHSR